MSGTHVITSTDEGLILEVDGAPCAVIRDRQGCRDLIWTIQGPKDLETSRRIIIGLLDLLVHYDAVSQPIASSTKKRRSKFA